MLYTEEELLSDLKCCRILSSPDAGPSVGESAGDSTEGVVKLDGERAGVRIGIVGVLESVFPNASR